MRPAHKSFFRYPLDRVFDSSANVRVLRALVRYGSLITTNMLIDQTGLTRMSVLSAVRRLADLGLVDSVGSERQRLSRFNEASSLAGPIKSLFEAEGTRFNATVSKIRETAERMGAEAVWIYGSVARGGDHPASDIDVAVVAAVEDPTEIAVALKDHISHLGTVQPSITVFNGDEIARLERERDPWWVAVKQEAVVVMGNAPDTYVAKAGKRGTRNYDASRKRKAG
jgi:predicted nucleotidyltransferase